MVVVHANRREMMDKMNYVDYEEANVEWIEIRRWPATVTTHFKNTFVNRCIFATV